MKSKHFNRKNNMEYEDDIFDGGALFAKLKGKFNDFKNKSTKNKTDNKTTSGVYYGLPKSDSGATNNQNQSNGQTKPDYISTVFIIIYGLLVLIAVSMLVVHFITLIADIFIYIFREFRQRGKLNNNPNLFNTDTHEYRILHYAKYIIDDEPYNIFLRQKILNSLYTIVKQFIVFLGIQLFIYLVIIVIKLSGIDIDIEPPSNEIRGKIVKYVVTIAFVFISSILFTYVYNQKFIKKLQKDFINTKASIEEINNHIYNNMTTNSDFLEALREDNKVLRNKLLNNQTTEYSLSKMIFTLSLFEYMTSNIKKGTDEYNEIIKIFTEDQIKIRSISPVDYFYYKQNVFIPNMYTKIKDDVKPNALTINNSIDIEKENNFNYTLNNRINSINNKLLKLLKMSSVKSNLLIYILIMLLVSIIVLVILTVMYIEPIINVLSKIKTFLRR